MKKEYIDLALKLIAFSLIVFALLLIVLELVGVIHSPSDLMIQLLIGGSFLIEVIHLERTLGDIKAELGDVKSKANIMWSDFKKRKKI